MSFYYVLYFVLLVASVQGYWDSNLDLGEIFSERRADAPKGRLDNTFFPALDNYQVRAVQVSENKYPWIARVIHSRTYNEPHVCTAACIDKGIFITAARCIHSLKINYTGIRYGHKFLDPVAFVLPSVPSKQAFDDIGFLVVDPALFNNWALIDLYSGVNRTDDNFNWFKPQEYTRPASDVTTHKVVGYALEKRHRKELPGVVPYELFELKVIVGIEMCVKLHAVEKAGFHVPCYFSCTLKEFNSGNPKCSEYLGAEGCAVIDVNTKKLIGIATWGANIYSFELPVGMAIPNSDNFFKDYACARKIRSKARVKITENYFQKLCDKI